MIPKDRRYTKEHEWIITEGDTGTIGITQHASDELGDITYVELPAPGTSFSEGDSVVTLESVKAVSPVYCPATGSVIEINTMLEDSPELINTDCYNQGWIIKLKLTSGLKDQLLDSEEYEEYLKSLENE